jgi:uncharacterized protein (DUF58 family)
MDFGDPSKLDQARTLAAMLGYVGLNGGDAVSPRTIGVRQPEPRAIRGRAGYPRLSDWLSRLKPPEETKESLSVALRSFAAGAARAGIALVLSDGLDPDVSNAIRLLGSRGHEVWFLQILSPVEIDPDLEGDLRLIDGEGGSPREITANSYVIKEYRQRLEQHNAALSDAVRRVGGRYALVTVGEGYDQLLKNVLKREGWLI